MTIAELVEALAVQTCADAVYGPSLIAQLRDARYASTGGTRGKATAAAARVQLNLDAHLLWEDLTGQIAAEYAAGVDEVSRAVHQLPELYLLKWSVALTASTDRHDETPEREQLRLAVAHEKLGRWIDQIRNLLDPPQTIELTEPCPNCGESRARSGEGELEAETSAVAFTIRPGEEIVAQCRNSACRAKWVGDQEVIQLGRQVGRDIDPDKIREARSAVAA